MPSVLARRLVTWSTLGALTLGACQGAEPEQRFPLREPFASPTSRDTLVVGFVGTLSGPESWRGEDAFEGADLGVHELNRARPPDIAPFELVQLDDRGSAAVATELVKELAALGSIVGVIYAGPPEGLPPAEAALARAGIPAVLCYGDLHAASALSDHIFQASPPLEWQARIVARYLGTDRRYTRVGAVVERSPEGAAALAGLRRAVGAGPLRLTAARYGPGRGGLRGALARLRARHTEAVVIPGSPGRVSEALGLLSDMGAAYRTTAAARIASAPRPVAARRRATSHWHPQPVGLDLAVSPRTRGAPPGMVAPETYARAAHLVPIATLAGFARNFERWWGSLPAGWEQRAFDAARAIGWAAIRSGAEDDLAAVLEELKSHRLGGLPVSFSGTDHLAPEARTMGLWVVPATDVGPGQHAAAWRRFGWVPLARTFSRPGGATTILVRDRRALLRGGSAPPLYSDMRVAVTTSRRDPVH
jgi:ABC-type branched-subunit amino acid transport system substrate-binding protein